MATVISGDTGIDKVQDGSIVNADLATGIDAAKLTGTLPAIDGSSLTGISSYADSDALSLFNASGSAPVYACRAWVSVNTKTFSIKGSGNVSSITDNGTGRFTFNFATAMPDANYSTAGAAMAGSTWNNGDGISVGVWGMATTYFYCQTTDATANAAYDCDNVTVMVVR